MNHASCRLLSGTGASADPFRLDFRWDGPAPRAGQFFMVKPRRGGVFLGRPISVAAWTPADAGGGPATVTFLVARRGRGTLELADMRPGEEAELTGPLGNAWTDFLPPANPADGRSVALVGGGIGLAPFMAMLHENTGEGLGYVFHLYAGFRTDPGSRDTLWESARSKAGKVIIATEDGSSGHKGLVPDFLEPERHSAVCACGPEPMIRAVADRCAAAGVPCFVSLERRMACGVGACLGCTVKTADGNRRCCADGPVFDAREITFDG